MEGIGRVRKVKSKIKDGVEAVVDKSKEKLESVKDGGSKAEKGDSPKTDEKVDPLGESLEKLDMEGT